MFQAAITNPPIQGLKSIATEANKGPKSIAVWSIRRTQAFSEVRAKYKIITQNLKNGQNIFSMDFFLIVKVHKNRKKIKENHAKIISAARKPSEQILTLKTAIYAYFDA